MKNILPVTRRAHEATVTDLQARCAALVAERDLAFASVADAIEQASQARAIASRACALLAEVNATRTGGKLWDEKRTALFTDAKEQGVWWDEP